jgi:nucleoside-diphosphate-sugar epimerase
LLDNKKILVTGITGRVARPIAAALAARNEIWGIARFHELTGKEELQRLGIHCEAVDLAEADYSALPDDFDYVLHFGAAMAASEDFDTDLRVDAEATGLLMAHCRRASAFLHCSTGLVYQPNGRTPHAETDLLGNPSWPRRPTYSICNIAGEAVARVAARMLALPTVITRLNVAYGDNGIWPGTHLESILAGQPIHVHPDTPTVYSPIHLDDMIKTVPHLLQAASVPAIIVNWAGPQQVSVQEWSTYMAELLGLQVQFETSEKEPQSIILDTAKLQALAGDTTVDWRDGFRRMVSALHPELQLQP